MATARFDFPKNFLWGTATAAHQVEGSNVNSDFWLLEDTPGSPFVEPSGDACDQYHRYADDIAMLAALGFNSLLDFRSNGHASSRSRASSQSPNSITTAACSPAATSTRSHQS